MLIPEQFDEIEFRCWEDQLVAALVAALSPDQAIHREVIATEVSEATAAAKALGLKNLPDVSRSVILHGLLGDDDSCPMPRLRSARKQGFLRTNGLHAFVARDQTANDTGEDK